MTASILDAGSMTWPLRINREPGFDLLFVICELATSAAKAREAKVLAPPKIATFGDGTSFSALYPVLWPTPPSALVHRFLLLLRLRIADSRRPPKSILVRE